MSIIGQVSFPIYRNAKLATQHPLFAACGPRSLGASRRYPMSLWYPTLHLLSSTFYRDLITIIKQSPLQ